MINVETLGTIVRAMTADSPLNDLHVKVDDAAVYGTYRVQEVRQTASERVVLLEGAGEKVTEFRVPAARIYQPLFEVVD